MQREKFTRQRVKLQPLNVPASQSFSASQFNQITFQLSTSRHLLLTKSLRLNATVKLLQTNASGGATTTMPANDPNAVASAANGASLNTRIGAQSCIQTTNLTTLNSRTLETINQSGRYCATTFPLDGTGLDYDNRMSLSDPGMSKKSITAVRTYNNSHQISIPIVCGFLQGQDAVDLSAKGYQGLRLSLLLARNNTAMSGYDVFNVTPASGFKQEPTTVVTTQVGAASVGYQFELSNVTLSYAALGIPPKMFDSMPASSVKSIRTFNCLESTLVASDQTVALSLGCKNVISVTHSICPSIFTANPNVDSFQVTSPHNNSTQTTIGTPAPIQSVSYLRGGTLYPYEYPLDARDTAGVDPEGSVQSIITYPAMQSITLGDNRMVQLSTQTNKGIDSLSTLSNAGASTSMPPTMASDPSSYYILGTPIDLARGGSNYESAQYAVRIQSDLNDDASTANSFLTFVRCRNVIKIDNGDISVME